MVFDRMADKPWEGRIFRRVEMRAGATYSHACGHVAVGAYGEVDGLGLAS